MRYILFVGKYTEIDEKFIVAIDFGHLLKVECNYYTIWQNTHVYACIIQFCSGSE